jgi:hypothetical protein
VLVVVLILVLGVLVLGVVPRGDAFTGRSSH